MVLNSQLNRSPTTPQFKFLAMTVRGGTATDPHHWLILADKEMAQAAAEVKVDMVKMAIKAAAEKKQDEDRARIEMVRRKEEEVRRKEEEARKEEARRK